MVGGVLLAPGTAYAGTLVGTSTTVTASQTSTWHGTTLDASVTVTPASGTVAPSGNVKVSVGWESCFIALGAQGSNGVGSCDINNLPAGTYTVMAAYLGSSTFDMSSGSTTVTIGSAPVFTADSPPLFAADGQSYGYTFHATGSPTYALGAGAPSWLHIDSSSGAVWGDVPWWAGSFSYSVTATNSIGSATAGPYTVFIRHDHNNNVNIDTSLSCPARVFTGQRGSCTLWVTNRGFGPASDVSAQIALPRQLRADFCGYFFSFGCRISNNTAYEDLGTLNPGQTKSLTVVFTARGGFSLFGWNHHGWRFTVRVVGSASTFGNNWWWLGQRSSTSVAYVTIIPHGIWW